MTPRRLIEPARLAGSTLLRTQTDARLVDLVRAGHSAAFEAIVQRYRRPLLTYCARVLPDARAEDAVQQTFLSAYQAMTRDEADLNLRPWLYRIARNASLNLLRQNGWSHEQLNENLDGVERPDQALERREQLRSAVEALNALPERQRDALVQRELEGKRYDEIGAALGVGDGAVRQLLHRARATLRAGASALTPVGLLERIAELAGGAGAAKMGAALLATGAIAGGATLATPIARHHHPPPVVRAAAPEKPKRVRTVAEHVASAATVVRRRSEHHGSSHPRKVSHHHPGRQRSGSDHSGPGRGGDDRDNSGPGSGGLTTTTTPLTDDHSASGSGESGSGGGDTTSGSGSSGSGSGSSGSGSADSSSGSSGTGSGSGDSSGSSGSGSGSSSSGGGSSGSGSDDGH